MLIISIFILIIILSWIINLQAKVNCLNNSIDVLKKQYSVLSDLYLKLKNSTLAEEHLQKNGNEISNASLEKKPTEQPLKQEAFSQKTSSQEPFESHNKTLIKEKTIQKHTVKNNTAKSSQKTGFQAAMLGNIFSKIGALAVIVSIIMFINLTLPEFFMNPVVKISFAFIIAFSLIIGSFYMKKDEKLRNYSEVMLGLGSAALYVISYMGQTVLSLYGELETLIAGGLITIFTYFMAFRVKTLSMLVITLMGGYLTILSSNANTNVSYVYLLFLNIMSIAYSLIHQKRNAVNIINLIISLSVILGWQLYYDDNTSLAVTSALILWLCYVVYGFLKSKTDIADIVVSYVNYIALIASFKFAFMFDDSKLKVLFLSLILLYFSFAFILKCLNKEIFKTNICLAFVSLWFYLNYALIGIWLITAYSFVMLLIAFIIAKFDKKYLDKTYFLYFASVIFNIFYFSFNIDEISKPDFEPYVKLMFLYFVPLLSIIISSLIFKPVNKMVYGLLKFTAINLVYIFLATETIYKMYDALYYEFNYGLILIILGFIYALNFRYLSLHGDKNNLYNTLYYVLSICVAFISFAGLLIATVFPYLQGNQGLSFGLKVIADMTAISTFILTAKWTKNALYKYLTAISGFMLAHTIGAHLSSYFNEEGFLTVSFWIIYSGAATIYGILSDKKYLINSGIFFSIISLLRLFIFDMAQVDSLYRLIAFLITGVTLLIVSYVYSKYKKLL